MGKRGKKKSSIHPLAVLMLFTLIPLGPMFYNKFILYFGTPDIQYVKAKILRILAGQLYADPVSGYANFHPPFYHLFLAPFQALGLPIDGILFVVVILVVLSLFFFTYKIIERCFDRTVAMITCLMLPFTVEFMGCGNMLLPTAFYFAIPFYLGGLWVYLHPKYSDRRTIIYAALWGLTFLISPGYLFLIGLTMLYDLLVRRDYRRVLIATATLVVVLIPFYIQAYVIFSQGLFGTSAFAFWRGLPDAEFFPALLAYILMPTQRGLLNPLVWTAAGLTVFGIIGAIASRRKEDSPGLGWFLIIGTVAYLLTFYHFKPQYAIRIHLFVGIFLSAYAVRYLLSLKVKRNLVHSIFAVIIVGGIVFHYMFVLHRYEIQNEHLPGYFQTREEFSKKVEGYVDPEEYVLAYHGTYRFYILPWHPMHALMAYESGEYFQLTTKLSEQFRADYDRALACTTANCLDPICDRYGIRTAIAFAADLRHPVFQYINENWTRVWGDNYFRIYRRPPEAAPIEPASEK